MRFHSEIIAVALLNKDGDDNGIFVPRILLSEFSFPWDIEWFTSDLFSCNTLFLSLVGTKELLVSIAIVFYRMSRYFLLNKYVFTIRTFINPNLCRASILRYTAY